MGTKTSEKMGISATEMALGPIFLGGITDFGHLLHETMKP